VDAQPYFKRSLAERGILELKLRMAIHLNFLGGSPNYVFVFFLLDFFIFIFRFNLTGLA